ncbi:NAD-dependent epimerase/dehydratase family protein [Streptomyces palmae]|uniref:NAD-dependent epimerase/dehydratase family protein n=1 Tax=Streptomyces palmae TaxID=1701085 RepID=A0A4Z0HC43_9ACTN|nr:NAD-dependent epimerase/dehydratase family protein [Streptomyces palmae]TGB17100.1 NAD-dependent epimerase/dehydratase family protein [Streptomyces palmae]
MTSLTPGEPGPLKVVVVGATGNIGTSLVRSLVGDPQVGSITGIARRTPSWSPPKTTWISTDVGADGPDDLTGYVQGADAVVHLAWLFQPTHDPLTTWRTNVEGSIRVFEAVVAAGVPALVVSSSVGAYSPGPKDRRVDESWPTHGWPEAAYAREKAYVERVLDVFERDHPGVRVVRMRPGFVFQRGAAVEQRKLFAGPFVPGRLVRPGLVPLVPDLPGLRFQALHAQDAAEAFHQAVVRPVRGAFNLAAEPVVDARELADLLNARVFPVPAGAAEAALATLWHLRVVPATPALLRTVLRLPLMDTARAVDELGWQPRYSSANALGEFLRGLREATGGRTPPLSGRRSGGRITEPRAGVGGRLL